MRQARHRNAQGLSSLVVFCPSRRLSSSVVSSLSNQSTSLPLLVVPALNACATPPPLPECRGVSIDRTPPPPTANMPSNGD
jgi:hypothetical protein